MKKLKKSYHGGKAYGKIIHAYGKLFMDFQIECPDVGLRLLLNTKQMEYLSFTTKSGFVVDLHPNGVPGFPLDFGISVPVGYVASIGVRMVKFFDRDKIA